MGKFFLLQRLFPPQGRAASMENVSYTILWLVESLLVIFVRVVKNTVGGQKNAARTHSKCSKRPSNLKSSWQ